MEEEEEKEGLGRVLLLSGTPSAECDGVPLRSPPTPTPPRPPTITSDPHITNIAIRRAKGRSRPIRRFLLLSLPVKKATFISELPILSKYQNSGSHSRQRL